MDKKEYIERGEAILAVTRDGCTANVVGVLFHMPAADVVSRGVFEQIKWERDIAMQQLEEHGIPFGAKADVVEVVRCKDCEYCHISTDPKTNISVQVCGYVGYNPVQSSQVTDNDYCSHGERR